MLGSDHTLLLALSVGSVLCILVSYSVYVYQLRTDALDKSLKQKMKPDPTGWLVSCLVLTANCVVQLAIGATWWSLSTVAAQALGSFVIMLMSIRNGGWQFGKTDFVAIVIAVVALSCAQLFDEAGLGTVLTLVADGAGMFLIIRNAACIPGADRPLAWIISILAGPPAIAATVLAGGGVMLLLSPIYLMTVDVLVLVAIWSQRWKRHDVPMATPAATTVPASA